MKSCLGQIGEKILPIFIGIFHKPLEGFLLNNQDSMESEESFFVAQRGCKPFTGFIGGDVLRTLPWDSSP